MSWINKYMNIKGIRILSAILVAAISFFLLATKVPETKPVKATLQNVEESKETVFKFAGAVVASSLAISALPDDFASPLANSFTDMNKYFVIILAALMIERLLMVVGVDLVFTWVIPIACAIYIIAIIKDKRSWRVFSYKVAVFAMLLLLVVPVSTHLSKVYGEEYLDYVDETIEETSAGTEKINNAMQSSDGDSTVFDKISEAFKNAMSGIDDLITFFKNGIKKCMNSIAVLIVTTCVVPVVVLLLLVVVFKMMFKAAIRLPEGYAITKKEYGKPEVTADED